MSEGISYEAYVEVQPDGSCLAQLLDLPGCYVRDATEATALTKLAAAIPDYYAWLRGHDDYTPDVKGPFAVTPRVIEHVQLINGRIVGAFFTSDTEPVTDEDLDWLLALLDWAFGDLHALLSALPADALSRPGPDGRSPEALAEQTAQEQLWLVSRIEPQPTVPRVEQLPGAPLDHLRQVWQASLHYLRNTSDVERERILDHDGERWSLRKVLRRSVLHARIMLNAAQAGVR